MYVTTLVYIRGNKSGSIDFPLGKDIDNIDIEKEIERTERHEK